MVPWDQSPTSNRTGKIKASKNWAQLSATYVSKPAGVDIPDRIRLCQVCLFLFKTKRIAVFQQEANQILDSFPASDAKDSLQKLVSYVIDREF